MVGGESKAFSYYASISICGSRDLRLIFRTSQECALLLPKSNSTVEVKKVLCGTAWGAFLPCSSALPED